MYGASGTLSTNEFAMLQTYKAYLGRFTKYTPIASEANNRALTVFWETWNKSTNPSFYVGTAKDFDQLGNIIKEYRIVVNSNRAWNAYEISQDGSSIGTKTIYTNSTAATSIGDYSVYLDNKGQYYIKLTNVSFDVLDQSSNEITIANKTIIDYKTGAAPEIKLSVKTDGTNYYLASGLYETAKISLGFTKPATAVGAINLKVTAGSYILSPNILFAKSDLIDSIPTQYNGITRSSITTIDMSNGSFFKVSGSQITFGADTDVSLSFCLEKDLVKGIDVAAA